MRTDNFVMIAVRQLRAIRERYRRRSDQFLAQMRALKIAGLAVELCTWRQAVRSHRIGKSDALAAPNRSGILGKGESHQHRH